MNGRPRTAPKMLLRPILSRRPCPKPKPSIQASICFDPRLFSSPYSIEPLIGPRLFATLPYDADQFARENFSILGILRQAGASLPAPEAYICLTRSQHSHFSPLAMKHGHPFLPSRLCYVVSSSAALEMGWVVPACRR